MKFTIVTLQALILANLTSMAIAQSSLRIVDSYSLASDQSIWKGIQSDDIPFILQKSLQVARPAYAFDSTFPRNFYQEENFLVCYKECNQKDSSSEKDLLEQQNVYYWLGEFFKMTKERFDLLPGLRMKVITSRSINNPGTTKSMKNNAFFNPADGSLSFLPASFNPLMSLLGGKLNRSGFDPSVVAHEAAHSLFHTLFPLSINQEIGGINEGFADYLANVLLDDPKVGLVMLRGKPLRNSESLVDSSDKPKIYSPGLEVHNLGERFASALWIGRQNVSNAEEYDQLVISAIKNLSHNHFATAHSFKEAMLERIKYTYDSQTFGKLNALWELIFPGKDRRVIDTSFITSRTIPSGFWGLRVSTTFPESIKRELGIENDVRRFLFIKSIKTQDNFIANLVAIRDERSVYPYWIVSDPERKNSLGAWRMDGSVVDNKKEIEKIHSLAAQILVLDKTLIDFFNQASTFSELAYGKGELSLAYKVTHKETSTIPLEFISQNVKAKMHHLKLKRRVLGKVFGIPELQSVGIITLGGPAVDSKRPTYEGEAIIGLKLVLKDGTTTETILETISI